MVHSELIDSFIIPNDEENTLDEAYIKQILSKKLWDRCNNSKKEKIIIETFPNELDELLSSNGFNLKEIKFLKDQTSKLIEGNGKTDICNLDSMYRTLMRNFIFSLLTSLAFVLLVFHLFFNTTEIYQFSAYSLILFATWFGMLVLTPAFVLMLIFGRVRYRGQLETVIDSYSKTICKALTNNELFKEKVLDYF